MKKIKLFSALLLASAITFASTGNAQTRYQDSTELLPLFGPEHPMEFFTQNILFFLTARECEVQLTPHFQALFELATSDEITNSLTAREEAMVRIVIQNDLDAFFARNRTNGCGEIMGATENQHGVNIWSN